MPDAAPPYPGPPVNTYQAQPGNCSQPPALLLFPFTRTTADRGPPSSFVRVHPFVVPVDLC